MPALRRSGVTGTAVRRPAFRRFWLGMHRLRRHRRCRSPWSPCPGSCSASRARFSCGVRVLIVLRAAADGRCHVRALRLSSASRCPHAEQVFELGYQRSTATDGPAVPLRLVLQHDRNSAQPVLEIARASRRLRTSRPRSGPRPRSRRARGPGACWPCAAKSPARIVPPWHAHWRPRRPAFARFAEPRWQRREPALATASAAARAAPSRCGCGDLLPVDIAANWVRPDVYAGALARSRERHRVGRVDVECHEPAAGRVAGLGHRCRVQRRPCSCSAMTRRTRADALILARRSAPCFTRNAARV